MRKLMVIACGILLYGYVNGSTKVPKQTIVEIYELIERSYTNHVLLSPATKAELKPDGDRNSMDMFFPRELLWVLDTTLLKNRYSVSVCNEILRLPEGDTISVSIYDFINGQDCGKIAGLFKDNPFREVVIGVFEAPVTCLYFLNNGNLCRVCRIGLYHEENLKNELFISYIEQQAYNRLKQQNDPIN